MEKAGKVRGFYLPLDLMDWLERSARQEKRSTSNFLALLVREAKDRVGGPS